MPWIEFQRVEVLLRTDLTSDLWIEGLIDHAQGLAEVHTGPQAAPSEGLKSLLAQIVARMWQSGNSAAVNPAALQSETAGPYTIQDPRAGSAGLGLTDREIKSLRQAAGKTGLWVQPTFRSETLETSPLFEDMEDQTDPVEQLAAAQANLGPRR